MTTTPTNAPDTLTARAIRAAHFHRDTAPQEFAYRNTFQLQWDRRAMTAANLATALGVPIDAVIVRDDPDRSHNLGRITTPGDLLEVTSDDGRCWYFIPDMIGFDPLWGWLLLGECPECEATAVPLVRIASLADLGAHLDPETDHHGPDAMPPDFHGDPCHHAHCPHASDDTAAHPTDHHPTATNAHSGHRQESQP